MGSYSMSCGISGLEIAENDKCLVAILLQRGVEWSIMVPPIRGEYGDYGTLRINADDLALAQQFGISDSDWEPLAWDPGSDPQAPKVADGQWFLPFWISQVAFDALPGLIRDYSDRGPDGTVGEDTADHIAALRKALSSAQLDRSTGEDFIHDGKSLQDLLFCAALGRVMGSRPVLLEAAERFAGRSDAVAETLLIAYERSFILTVGSLELRRPLVGQNGAYGPQHSGERAMAMFAEALLLESNRRIAERVDY